MMSTTQAPSLRDGERTVNDLIAPGSIETRRNRVVVDGRASRVLALADYPRTVTANWLAKLLDSNDPIDVSMHITPVPPAETARMLERHLTQLQSERMSLARSGRLANSAAELAYSDTLRTREQLERGQERVFQVSCYLRVFGSSPDELDLSTGRVTTILGALLSSARIALYEQLAGLLSILPGGQDHLARKRNVDTSTLVSMIPFASSQVGDGVGLLYGTNLQSQSMVVLDPFARENANKVVFAASGAGKSFACKIEAMRALAAGVSYMCIDPEREYAGMAEALNGHTIRLSATSPHTINPFDLPPTEKDVSDPLAAHIVSMIGLLDLMLSERDGALSQVERAELDQALYACYAAKGITADPDTHFREVPVLADLVTALEESGDELALGRRLRRYTTGSLAHMFSGRSNVDLDWPFVIFDIRDLEQELRPLATYLIANHVWREVKLRSRPRLLLVDEAWKLMEHQAGATFLAGLARQARKHWLGLITISQDVGDFLHSDEGLTVVANSSVKLLMRQDPAVIEQVTEAFGLTPAESTFLTGAGIGEGLLLAGTEHAPIFIEASQIERDLANTTPSADT